MVDDAVGFIGSIPQNYDKGLGPMIFADYAVDIARRAMSPNPARVLETAAGTGIVSRNLYQALAPGAHLTVTDLNPPMLELARAGLPADARLTFRSADAVDLPFVDGTFDAVVCQFGLMFFPDKDKSFREVRRVLAAGGRYVFNVWDAQRYNPFGRIAHAVAGSFFPADPPQFYQVPFSCHAIDPVKEALIAAGFGDIAITVLSLEKVVPDAAAFATGLVHGNPLIDQIRTRGGVAPERIVEAMTAALTREFGPDPGRMPLQAIVFEASRL